MARDTAAQRGATMVRPLLPVMLWLCLLSLSPAPALAEECSKAFFAELRRQTNEADNYHDACAFYQGPVKADVKSMCRHCRAFYTRLEALAARVEANLSCFPSSKKRALSGLFNERTMVRKMMAKCR